MTTDAGRFEAIPLEGSPTRDPEVVRRWLGELAGEGWIETHIELAPWKAGDELPQGNVLAAEVSVAPDRSVHIRWNGAQWIGTTIVEHAGDEAGRVVATEFLSSRTGGRWTMRYRTWWSPVRREDDVAVLEPAIARFAGWQRSQESNEGGR
ncbi:MAG: hypothetical protein Q8Q09_22190 [Deltaproteobacteria bacterium]|nr:hypothetical protein [Deltaproteobacteria bacterium]